MVNYYRVFKSDTKKSNVADVLDNVFEKRPSAKARAHSLKNQGFKTKITKFKAVGRKFPAGTKVRSKFNKSITGKVTKGTYDSFINDYRYIVVINNRNNNFTQKDLIKIK